MTRKNFYSFLLFLTCLSCRKNHDGGGVKEDQLTYTGSSEELSEGRYSINILQTGNFTCFAGGSYFLLSPFGVQPSSNIDVYNRQTNNWSRFGLSVKRDNYGSAALNNKLVMAGGITPAYMYSDVADIFDLSNGQVTTKKLSKARSHLTAAGAGSKILFAGGILTGNPPTLTAAVDIFNTETGQWTTDTLSQASTEKISMSGCVI